MTQNMLKTYILRGFTNMIKYLGSEYLQLLKSNGQASRLISYMIKVSGSTESKQSQILNSAWLECSLAYKETLTGKIDENNSYWPRVLYLESQKDLFLHLPYEGLGNQSVLFYHAPILTYWNYSSCGSMSYPSNNSYPVGNANTWCRRQFPSAPHSVVSSQELMQADMKLLRQLNTTYQATVIVDDRVELLKII